MSTKVIQQRWLETARIVSVTKTRNENGSFSRTFTDVLEVPVRINQYMTYGNRNNIYDDIVDVGDVGLTYRKRYIVSSPNKRLETFVDSKMNNSTDNLDNYRLIYKGELFRMMDSKVTIEKVMDYNG